MERHFDDHSEASFTTAMATPLKPPPQEDHQAWDLEDTSPIIIHRLDDKENTAENTQKSPLQQYPLPHSSPPPSKFQAPTVHHHQHLLGQSNNAGEVSGENPLEIHHHTSRVDHHSADGKTYEIEENQLPPTASREEDVILPSLPSPTGELTSDVTAGVIHEAAISQEQEPTEIDAQVDNNAPLTPETDETDRAKPLIENENAAIADMLHSEPVNEAESGNIDACFLGETNIETKVVSTSDDDDNNNNDREKSNNDNNEVEDISAAFEVLQVDCRDSSIETDAGPAILVSEEAKVEDNIIPEVIEEVIRAVVSEHSKSDEDSPAAKEVAAPCEASSIPTQETVEPSLPALSAGKVETVITNIPTQDEWTHGCEDTPALPSEESTRSASTPSPSAKSASAQKKKKKTHKKKKNTSAPKKRVSEASGGMISPPKSGAHPEIDFASTYKLEPTIPRGPKLKMLERRPSHLLAADTNKCKKEVEDFAETYKLEATIPRGPELKMLERLPLHSATAGEIKNKKAVEDFAQTYKLEPTIPRGPELNVERRCTMAATRLAVVGKSPPPAPKEEIDYAKSYKLEPTVPKSPQFTLAHKIYAKNINNTNNTSNASATRSTTTTPDFAVTYKLEPTIPMDMPSHHAKRPAKETCSTTSSSQPDTTTTANASMADNIDYAKFYNGELTKPCSPKLSFMVKKTATKSPKTTPSPSANGKSQQFKARPLPSYIRRTSSGISPRRYSSSRINNNTNNNNSSSSVSPPGARRQFKARPLPSYIKRGGSGVSPRSTTTATDDSSQNKAKSPAFKARPMPNFDRVAIRPRVSPRARASPRRGTMHPTSNGMNNTNTTTNNNNMSKKAAYIPLSVGLHDQAVAAFNEKLEAEKRILEERRNFKALPLSADMLEGALFVPKLGQFSPTKPIDVVTYSRDRAIERRQFDERNAERVCAFEHAQKMAEEARRLDEIAKTKERLDKYAFKARPVPQSLYRDPLAQLLSPHTPKEKIRRTKRHSGGASAGNNKSSEKKNKNNNNNNNVEEEEKEDSSLVPNFSPGNMLANVRNAIGKLSPV